MIESSLPFLSFLFKLFHRLIGRLLFHLYLWKGYTLLTVNVLPPAV